MQSLRFDVVVNECLNCNPIPPELQAGKGEG